MVALLEVFVTVNVRAASGNGRDSNFSFVEFSPLFKNKQLMNLFPNGSFKGNVF